MAALGKLANSVVSFTNENTLALLNVNIDFALVRCDPSAEYSPVGSALTVKRKYEAENGALHAIACKLGFLFHEMLPDTPKLHRAYGTRISEILSHPGVNPEGTKADGPFQDFIGADCTSIWAAATSGPASISMLFLACMLSRAWDAKTATSIWVELIEERKKHIWARTEGNKIVHPYSQAAAKQDISRSDLASWDASARAWLRRADVAMELRNTQLRLVTKNLNIPYWSAGSTFERVTMNWIRSMEMLEKLLSNIPQEASTRAALLGMSSWHLYPDMLVFQQAATKIPFDDELFPNAGILSVGLEYKGPADNVTQWSLSLSHLRYYGDPVLVRSDDSQGRLPPHKLWVAALGVIFRQWGVSYSKFDDAVAWFQALGKVLNRSNKAQGTELSWLVRLCAAASAARPAGQPDDGGLIKYGWRRAGTFLGEDGKAMRCPFFGLCNPYTMSALSKDADVDCGIAYLRGIVTQLGLAANEAVISYTGSLDHECSYSEWATIAPIEAHFGLGSSAGGSQDNSPEKRHTRWLHAHRGENGSLGTSLLSRRQHEIEREGENCHIVVNENEVPQNVESGEWRYSTWTKPPLLFSTAGPAELVCLGSFQGRIKFKLWVESNTHDAMGSQRFLHRMQSAQSAVALEEGLSWLEQTAQSQRVVQYLLESLTYVCADTRMPQTRAVAGTKRKAPMDESAPDEHEGRLHLDDTTSCFRLMSRICNPSKDWLLSLRMLEAVNHLYRGFAAATVSLRILDRDLLKAKWAQSCLDICLIDPVRTPAAEYLDDTGLAASFSCIAMLESGYLDIDPHQMKQVVALCSEDSIFVAGVMLSDPSVETDSTVRHLVGNVGHSGMVLMVSPIEPRIRAVGHDPQLVAHQPFDNKSGDSFGGTSLHLSFTTWKVPLDWADTGAIDRGVYLLESVVSVQDSGKWVADIDVLGMVYRRPDVVFACDQDCAAAAAEGSTEDIVSIDSWEEFLDPPPCAAVFRATNNWAARLAAVCIWVRQSKAHAAVIVRDERVCLSCLKSLYSGRKPLLPPLIIN